MKPAIWFPAVRSGSGADTFTERLVIALNEQGLRAEINWLPLRAEYAPWTVARLPIPKWANIVHINTWLHPRFIPQALPIVATIHGCVHDPALGPYKTPIQAIYHRYWIYQIEKEIIQRADRIVAVSHYTAEKSAAAFDRQDIQVIPNGIDLNGPFYPVKRHTAHRPFRLLYVGNWSRRKGVDLLGPIMEKLGNKFVLYYTADRKGVDKKYSLPSNTCCMGRLYDPAQLAKLYREADALLFPSRLEGMPLTVLEAQACGLPVIAARTSSLPEIIHDGVNGLLCEKDNIDEFIAVARKLHDQPEIWQGIRQAAFKVVENRFDLTKTVKSYIQIYRSLL